ncbi:hyaluronidase-2-like isoform X2 [Sinocyclocheilus grahami]|uniref:hyaluronidase-2-like isoform X2 n=2 Tax=Sinocyclocheilus grahami TaxID=75366 RepID=UPI0007AD5BAD|nr:PREDICTED: hyaluronidase-2-like isoform X2 [Sinocyclocheilus grahami]
MSDRTGVLNGFSPISTGQSEMRNITRLFGATQPQWVSWLWLLFSMLFWTCLKAQQLKNTRWPLYSGKPLLLAWNAPTEDCRPRHDVTFQLDQFQIVASPNEGFTKQNLTIFYQDRLGMYPYFESDSTPVNGGLPQIASLTQHLERMPEGLKKYIKDPTVKGLAVIDWEEWRPLWIRNWGPKDIYRDRSRRLVAEKNPTSPQDQVAKVAQQEFELSACKFMLETLRSAKSLRPQQLWGFYLFPDCYNHNYQSKNYTGRCPDVEVTRNDQLKWLWMESTALYPSIYMANMLKDQLAGRQFVRNRVKEGMRLASVGNGSARPVFVYTRPTYQNNPPASNGNLLELLLLTETACSSLNEYLRGPLGRYLLNVTSAAEQCSRNLCGFRGRCLRKRPDTDTYLHLSPNTHSIERQGNTLKVSGQMGEEELSRVRDEFQCQCYNGYVGDNCSQRDAGNRAALVWTTFLQVLLLPLLLMGFLH